MPGAISILHPGGVDRMRRSLHRHVRSIDGAERAADLGASEEDLAGIEGRAGDDVDNDTHKYLLIQLLSSNLPWE